jgi:hypothetical protein
MKRTIATLLVLLFATTVSFAQGAPAKKNF